LTLGVWTKYQRLTIRQAGRQLRKCTGDVREVSHNDRVCAGWKVRHLLLQPVGLSGRPTLHALTVIPKFDEGLRDAELSQAHGFEGAIGGAREYVADRNPQLAERLAHGNCGIPSDFVQLAFGLAVVGIRSLFVRHLTR